MSLLTWMNKNAPEELKNFKTQSQKLAQYIEISSLLKKQIVSELRNTYQLVFKFENGIFFDINHIQFIAYDDKCGCYQMIRNDKISDDELLESFGPAILRDPKFSTSLIKNYDKLSQNQKDLEEFKNQMISSIRSKLPAYFYSDKNNTNYVINSSDLFDSNDCCVYVTKFLPANQLVNICLNLTK